VVHNFVAQPYPLFAIVVVTGHWKPYVGRVVGWERVDDSHTGVLGPVLALGGRTFVPSVSDHVDYEESREEAERRAPAFANAIRQAGEETRGTRLVPEQRTAPAPASGANATVTWGSVGAWSGANAATTSS
jgi:hypothetical protein